ncbi:probable CCR4-associated factor 1 homolog 11 [Salvia miltiorrhiza]|uniref:probable CCR4-associated factor 1 homolog 11 n=1 Tax=Salvia miltiorrhiza TaxID=226208 RepID=UPI0025AD5F6B|nr:probable CCR4-associated factor 1 homolog 11 [Salvia miltiorrhiza]
MAVVIRKVWQSNLEAEFGLIKQCSKNLRLASMDTEFPGTVFSLDIPKHRFSTLSPAQQYALMKKNVDALNIIQLGLTLSDASSRCCVWEFNFRDFDSDYDDYNPDSVAFLRSKGINFDLNKRRGINSRSFAAHFLESGLGSGRAWVTFHGLYDFGFLIKILTRAALPDHLHDFMMLLRRYLGVQVYDVKPIARSMALHGGLDAIAKTLFVERAVGKSHQAGSDSLLTMQLFLRFLITRGCCYAPAILALFNCRLYGLTC